MSPDGGGTKRRGFFARLRTPSAEALYAALRAEAQLRLKLVDGKPFAAVLEKEGAVLLLPVPGKDFFEFIDSFQISKGERLAKPKALRALGELITTVTAAPGFGDELPLGFGPGLARRPGHARP